VKSPSGVVATERMLIKAVIIFMSLFKRGAARTKMSPFSSILTVHFAQIRVTEFVKIHSVTLIKRTASNTTKI
jgi:hypothetical protein